MAMVRVTSIVATTNPVPAYGGIRFHVDVMHQVAEAIRDGKLPMRFDHDATRPVTVSNVDAGVRLRDDGEHEVWCDFDTNDDEWAAWEAHLAANEAPGGMSISVTLPIGSFEAGGVNTLPGLTVDIAADAHHFARADLIEAGAHLAQLGPVNVNELMQFSNEPPALIVLGFLLDPGQQIAWGVVGNYVYDVLRRLRADKGSALHLEVTEGERNVMAVIPVGASDEVAKAAIRAFERIATRSVGGFEYDGSGAWRSIEGGKGP